MWKLTPGYPTSSRFSCNISKEGGGMMVVVVLLSLWKVFFYGFTLLSVSEYLCYDDHSLAVL
jgi:hypothetical protein